MTPTRAEHLTAPACIAAVPLTHRPRRRNQHMKGTRRPRPLTPVSRASLAELRATGKSLREKCPRYSHADWNAPDNRPDPLRMLEQSNKGRLPELIPVRHGRMVRTPCIVDRGATLNIAADLARTRDDLGYATEEVHG